MGTNNIPTASNGSVIPASDHNSLKEALTLDLVPRNSSGVPTAIAGNCGTGTYPWLAVFFGAVASGLSLAESAGKMLLKVSGVTRVTIGTGGIESGSYGAGSIGAGSFAANAVATNDIANNAVTYPKLASNNNNIATASGAGTVTTTSYVEKHSLTITGCTGSRPVLVFVTTGTAESSGTNSNIIGNTYVELRRNGTALCNVRNDALSMPPIIHLDTSPATGNNTYTLWMKNDGTIGGYSDLRLQAVEL